MGGMRLYCCQKSVLRITTDAAKFLNAYTSNAPDRPRTAFLDRAGKIVAVADQVLLNPNEALIVVESRFVKRLLGHLAPYLQFLLTKIRIEEALKVYFDLDTIYKPLQEEWVVSQKKGQLILTSKELPASVTEEEFKKFRLTIRLPVQGVDFDDEMLLCVGDEDYVSYTKGCYLGQEIIARVHFRGVPPKKLTAKKEGFVFVVQ